VLKLSDSARPVPPARGSPAWSNVIGRFCAEAAGVVDIYIVLSGDVIPLNKSAGAGDRISIELTCAIFRTLVQMHRDAPACLCCAAAIRQVDRGGQGIGAFCIVLPAAGDESLVMAICPRCAARADQPRHAVEALRRRLWPDLRAIEVMPGPERLQ
jgi:hypothetical protein